MKRPVVGPAQGCNEFIAHPTTKRARLHEAKVVGIRRGAPADEAGLLGNESEMLLVAIAFRLRNRKGALVDALPRIVGVGNCGLPCGDDFACRNSGAGWLLIGGCRRELREPMFECLLDELGVSGREGVLGFEPVARPSCRTIGRFETGDIAEELIA
jgi:hypothetical protein